MTYRSASARALAFDDALREAMSTPITDTLDTQGSPASDPAAGTPGTEGVAVEAVAADPAVRDASLAAPDGDRVEHGFTLKAECPYCQDLTADEWLGICDCFAVEPFEAREMARRARLAWYQRQA